ncbi:MAG: protein kinase [Chloroflexia bacterium]|nr:protein kinase [Chloroflexia bacterium]
MIDKDIIVKSSKEFISLLKKEEYLKEINSEYKIKEILHYSSKSIVCLVAGIEGNDIIVKKLVGKGRKLREKIINEYDLLKSMQELSCVPELYKFDPERNTIVLSYIKGMDLDKYLYQNSPSLNEKLDLIKSVVSSYRDIYKKGVRHGDVHPKNIIINNQKQAIILDFGNSGFINSVENSRLRNVGLSFFVAPERLSFDCFNKFIKMPDDKSEVYQVSLLAYLIIYGKLPFQGGTWKKLVNSIKNWDQDLPGIMAEKDLATRIYLFLRKGLQKNPNERFNNINEMAEYLKLYF